MDIFKHLDIVVTDGITVITMKEELTYDIARKLIDYIVDNDLYKYRLLDMNGHSFKPTQDQIKALAWYDDRMPKRNFGAWAIDKNNQLTFGMARVYGAWRSDDENCTVSVFYSFEEAFNCLKIQQMNGK